MKRCDFNEPPAIGWYGVLFTDGEGEVWVGAIHWDGSGWGENVSLAYARSESPFATKDAAFDWASDQPD